MKFMELWELYLKSRPLSSGTIRNYRYKEKKFDSIWEREIEEISALEIQTLYNSVKRQSAKYDYDFITLKSVFQFAVELGIIKETPIRFALKRSAPSKTHELLTKEDIMRLVQYLQNEKENKVKATLLLVELLTGARVSEIRAFQKKNIDTKKHTVLIAHQYNVIGEDGTEGLATLKTQEAERLVYLPRGVRKVLYDLIRNLKDEEFVFSRNGKPYSIVTINLYLAQVCDKLDIVRLSTHKLRALYATIAIYAGVNVFTISGQMGHKSLKETERYFKRLPRYDLDSLKKIDKFLK
ncbi:tyrosine-type recombinase/integrase [Filifactor villosus]|uniref:Tyrosine-type recombinase/integrase n=1 Tax=Filifactor villosus TaxID=29374 RepID=A0ABV9QJ73_9FIRM